jgi:hypothetical protein
VAAVQARRIGGAFVDLAYAGNTDPYYLLGPDAPPLWLTSTSFNALNVLGVRVISGRSFTRDDVVAGTRVGLLREEVWRNRFGAASDLIGRRFLDRAGSPIEIRGVLPAGFLVPSVNWASARDGLILELDTFDTASRRDGIPGVFGRLKPDSSVRAAQEQFDAIIAATEADAQPDRRSTVVVKPMQQGLFWNYGVPLELLFACGSLVWLIACANLLPGEEMTRGDVHLWASAGQGHAWSLRSGPFAGTAYAAARWSKYVATLTKLSAITPSPTQRCMPSWPR